MKKLILVGVCAFLVGIFLGGFLIESKALESINISDIIGSETLADSLERQLNNR